jgi:N-acetylneuraminate 9-O-acetyltransferase
VVGTSLASMDTYRLTFPVRFIILYATMAIGSKYNDRSPFLIGKILASSMMIAWFMHQPWLLGGLFDLLERVFAIHWSAKEWAFRVNLDILMVHVGMLTAVAYIKFKDHRIAERVWWTTAVKASIVVSAGILVYYFIFELSQESKFTYNKWYVPPCGP